MINSNSDINWKDEINVRLKYFFQVDKWLLIYLFFLDKNVHVYINKQMNYIWHIFKRFAKNEYFHMYTKSTCRFNYCHWNTQLIDKNNNVSCNIILLQNTHTSVIGRIHIRHQLLTYIICPTPDDWIVVCRVIYR